MQWHWRDPGSYSKKKYFQAEIWIFGQKNIHFWLDTEHESEMAKIWDEHQKMTPSLEAEIFCGEIFFCVSQGVIVI